MPARRRAVQVELRDPGWRVDVHYEVDRDREVDADVLDWLVLPRRGSAEPARLNRLGVATVLADLADAGDVFDADVPHLLQAVDRGAVELWVHGSGAARPFARELRHVVYLVHEPPGGGDEALLNGFFRPRP